MGHVSASQCPASLHVFLVLCSVEDASFAWGALDRAAETHFNLDRATLDDLGGKVAAALVPSGSPLAVGHNVRRRIRDRHLSCSFEVRLSEHMVSAAPAPLREHPSQRRHKRLMSAPAFQGLVSHRVLPCGVSRAFVDYFCRMPTGICSGCIFVLQQPNLMNQ